jgi:2-polyprenyl-3-methyl-5-hydroxy-6-metoxy-1,4-benzoquinol methylase
MGEQVPKNSRGDAMADHTTQEQLKPDARLLEPPHRRIAGIVDSYDTWLVKAYCKARFRIIHPRFLEEMRQFMPQTGRVSESGCGLGLFGLYFAQSMPGIQFSGIDLNEHRIGMASRAAERLGLKNATFAVGDARTLSLEGQYQAIYMLDILHHIPPLDVPVLLQQIYGHLADGGVLLIKDVDTHPRHQMWFTWLLDVAMTRGEIPTYWSSDSLIRVIRETGFQVFTHSMLDSLPYPHRLYVCFKGNLGHLSGA